MSSLFIATVGMGTGPEVDITKPLIKSIQEANPSFLLLFITDESKANAEIILKELKRDDKNSAIHILTNKDHLQDIFKEMNDKITELWKQGKEPQNTIVDFTTGTKPMSAALALCAIKHNCSRLKYISVKRDHERKVIPDSETTSTFEPVGIFASFAIDTAIKFIKDYRFDSAIALLKSLNQGLLSDEEKQLVENLINIANAYNSWDKFNHIQFCSYYKKVNFENPEIKQFIVNEDTKSKIHRIGADIKQGIITELTIVDLVNNAKRRFEEGKYDDSVARLYRAMEMLGQWQLKVKYNQDTSNINMTSLPPKTVDWISKYREDGKIKIALQKSYQLLDELDDELGKEFRDDSKLSALLKERNESILAHGTKPITKAACDKLLEEVINYCKKYIDNFDELQCKLTFPWQC
jgi:CRISPR-associated protein (TIGR02710 family)